jgi:hypothetical protein
MTTLNIYKSVTGLPMEDGLVDSLVDLSSTEIILHNIARLTYTFKGDNSREHRLVDLLSLDDNSREHRLVDLLLLGDNSREHRLVDLLLLGDNST